MNTNLTILKGEVGLSKEVHLTHAARLAAVRDYESEPLSDELVALSETSGFRWSVSAEKLWERFNYHANLRGCGVRDGSDMPVGYMDDIPDFALERAEIAIKLGMKCITLHSIVPLAVDPIMVGWFDNPLTTGFILAAWIDKRELEL